MPMEYKITKVSTQEPRKWDGPKGTVYYINVMLEGHQRPVSIGKKAPDALKPGDTVYGDIEPTSYAADKFKSQQNPGQGNFQKGKQPMDPTTMYVSYAKDLLVEVVKTSKDATEYEQKLKVLIELIAKQGKHLKQLVEEEQKEEEQKPTKEEANQEAIAAIIEDKIDEPFNLDDLPLGF